MFLLFFWCTMFMQQRRLACVVSNEKVVLIIDSDSCNALVNTL